MNNLIKKNVFKISYISGILLIFIIITACTNTERTEDEWCSSEIGTIINETGLSDICWQKNVSYKHRTWYEATDYCKNLDIDPYMWTAPNKEDIEKLIFYLQNVNDSNYYVLGLERINFIKYLQEKHHFLGVEPLWDWYWINEEPLDLENKALVFSLYSSGNIDYAEKNDSGERSRKRIICISKK